MPSVIVLVGGLWEVSKSWGWSPYEWVSALKKEIFSLFYHMKTQKGGVSCEPGGVFSPECDHAGAFILDFPASRMVSSTFLLFVSHSIWSILLQQPKWVYTSQQPFEVVIIIIIITSFQGGSKLHAYGHTASKQHACFHLGSSWAHSLSAASETMGEKAGASTVIWRS